MSFTIESWKQQAAEKLYQTGQWLKQRTAKDTPYLAYGTLCGLSLWPLVEAAQAGQILPVMMTLGSVAAGVGGNLLANQLQAWKDRADDLDEADIVEWVAANAPAQLELRQALDDILEKLEAIPQAQAGLPASDQQWFAHLLREELAQLGNLTRFEATLVGSGAIAQGPGAVAVGKKGVYVGGSVEGSIITGDQNRLVDTGGGTYIEKQEIIHQPAGPDVASLRAAYLNHLFEATSHLSLAGVDPKAASNAAKASLNLGEVYTALLTLTPESHDRLLRGEMPDREMRQLSALAQLDQQRKLVLLGDPGTGKSTLVNFMAMCLAGESLGRPEANLARLTAPLPNDEGEDEEEAQPWRHGPLLPVRVILRDCAARGLPKPGHPASARHLWNFIVGELEAAALADYAPHLQQELQKQGGLILLDGLDEVPEAQQRREQLKAAVEDFVAAYPRCRVLVTSRTYAYQQQEWRLSGFAETVLAPFSQGQIHRFVDRWYSHIAHLRGLHPDDAQGRAELLRRAIFGSDRLQALAERPLLLTLMASLHAWRGGSLPEKREELYADTVDLLLDWWESPKTVRNAEGQVLVLQPSLIEWLKVDKDKVRALLNELAFQAHISQPELVGTADVDEGKLVSGLMRLSQNPDVNPAWLVEYLSQRAGLLLPRGVGVYTFPHRTFQEYLAACYLTDHDYPDRVAELARNEPNRWREAALLAGAKAARGTAAAIWLLVEALCFHDAPPAGQVDNLSSPDIWGALLSGQALVETASLEQVSERNQPKLQRVQRWLACLLERGELPVVDRAAAGRSLGRLGDPREEVSKLPPLLTPVIKGKFLYGEEKEERETGPFQAGVYLITNAQFAPFVAARGYEQAEWWSEAGWRECLRQKWTRPRLWDDPRWNNPNHPVVGVSWYEAEAFCGWLTATYGQVYRLPTEVEWERLARGQDGREYPWGDDWQEGLANTVESDIGRTSSVGLFPGGVSPSGAYDCAGNVWEWCADWGDKEHKYRVLRGGAFNFDESLARCAFRLRYFPDDWLYSFGFRVVVSPIL